MRGQFSYIVFAGILPLDFFQQILLAVALLFQLVYTAVKSASLFLDLLYALSRLLYLGENALLARCGRLVKQRLAAALIVELPEQIVRLELLRHGLRLRPEKRIYPVVDVVTAVFHAENKVVDKLELAAFHGVETGVFNMQLIYLDEFFDIAFFGEIRQIVSCRPARKRKRLTV